MPDLDRQLWSWASPSLGGRELQVARWGWYGKPVLLFSTAAADCLDYERFLMIRMLWPLIEAGRIKVYSCGSITGEAWMNRDAHPAQRAALQAAFADYVEQELLPHIERDCDGLAGGYCAAGASIGAFNALHASLRSPHRFDLCISMSGTYAFDRWMDGWRDDTYYHHQPLLYVGGLPEGPRLDMLRQNRFVIATGQGRAEAPDESRRMAALLQAKGLNTSLEIWGPDCHHDWPTWRTMLPMFLDRLI